MFDLLLAAGGGAGGLAVGWVAFSLITELIEDRRRGQIVKRRLAIEHAHYHPPAPAPDPVRELYAWKRQRRIEEAADWQAWYDSLDPDVLEEVKPTVDPTSVTSIPIGYAIGDVVNPETLARLRLLAAYRNGIR